MPLLTATSPPHQHTLQTLLLLTLSLLLSLPLTYLALASHLLSPYLSTTAKHTSHTRKWRLLSSSTFRPRRILVTGLSMSKGLALARIFHRAGHTVIGADFEDGGIWVPGRFSTSLAKFYRLPKPVEGDETSGEVYIAALLEIVREEEIDLWVSVSGEVSALEDGEAAEEMEKGGLCGVVQFGLTLTETLHDKFSFVENTKRLGLNVPLTHLVTSETEALSVLYPEKLGKGRSKEDLGGRREFVMKSITLDSSSNRANMTLLPRPSVRESEAHVRMLGPTPFKPFVLQQFIRGREYCAHSLIISGQIRAFVACPSREMLLHYRALPTTSLLSRAMESYLSLYAARTGPGMTGHFSVDFLVEEEVAVGAEERVEGVGEDEVRALMGSLFPIECNPRANTAVLLFSDVAEELAEVYLEILERHEPKVNGNHQSGHIVYPKPGTPGYYWIGHDFVTLVLLPLFSWMQGEKKGLWSSVGREWMVFLSHVWGWRDGVWEVWDPWPAWWFYVGYWPLRLARGWWMGRIAWWGRINLATGKVFGV